MFRRPHPSIVHHCESVFLLLFLAQLLFEENECLPGSDREHLFLRLAKLKGKFWVFSLNWLQSSMSQRLLNEEETRDVWCLA